MESHRHHAQSFIPYFKAKKSGLFITTTSICGLSSYPLSSIYNASKWALEGWSESMSYDLAQFNIGIKNVAPGGIKSNYMNVMKVAQDPAYETLTQRLSEGFTDGTLMQFSEAEVIAQVVYEAATDSKSPQIFNSISELHQKPGLPKPLHPLLSLVDYSHIKADTKDLEKGMVFNFYKISWFFLLCRS